MKNLFLIFVIFVAIFVSVILLPGFGTTIYSQSDLAVQKIDRGKPYVSGQLLVKFKEDLSTLQTQSAHSLIDATVLQTFDQTGWQLVELPDGVSVDEGLMQYQQLPGCLYAQPNYKYQIYINPNDPQFSNPSFYGMAKISAPAAWDTTTGNPAVVVADIDTGVDYNHQDLAANMWHNPGETPNNSIDDDNNGYVDDYYGYDFINNDSNPSDDNGHGTHTTGTIGAVGNNSTGVVGVNWNVKLMALKTHNSGGNSTAATVIAAFNYVTMMRNRGINIRVTNNSWGGAPEAPAYDQALKDAIDLAGNAGVLNVFAAGNDNQNIDSIPSYPGSYNSPSILTVASSTSTDAKSGFSSFGPTSVDVAAPGSGIISTFPSDSYGSISGTSMATPHVAGAAALLVGLNPNLSPASLKATLMNTVDAVPAFNGLVVTGGRINVAVALSQQTVCNFSLSQPSQSVPSAGGNFSVNLLTNSAACSWGAFSNANWITISSASGGTGNATISYTVNAHAGGMRTGTLQIGGQTFTVNQAGAANCSFSISPTEQSFSPTGGGGSVNVFTQGGCAWNASSNDSWITITSGASGSGNGTVTYTVATSSSGALRTGTMTIANQTFTVRQGTDIDGDGIPDTVEIQEGTNPNLKDNDIFTNARLFAMQQYRDFLGREGDAGGVTFWTNQINSAAQSRAQVINNFFNSSEFQQITPVTRLYFAYFLRIPDYPGLNFWVGQYRSGASLEAISQEFALSQEFINRYGSLTNEQFVTLVYQNVLNRQPDADGSAFWVGQLNSQAITRGQMMVGFSESSEYRARIANEVYVEAIYVGMLRRSPEQGGFDFWVNALDGGASGLNLIQGFLDVTEYHNRFLP